jgi:hypothetical protein
MPHPERASEAILGCADGRLVFESLIRSLEKGLVPASAPDREIELALTK